VEMAAATTELPSRTPSFPELRRPSASQGTAVSQLRQYEDFVYTPMSFALFSAGVKVF
jgi:hypothetical protein